MLPSAPGPLPAAAPPRTGLGESGSQFEQLINAAPGGPAESSSLAATPLAQWVQGLAQRQGELKGQLLDRQALTPDMGLIPTMNRLTELQIQRSVLAAEFSIAQGTISRVKSGLNTLIKGA